MPLYQILNEEMIDFDKPELPKDDLEFLCKRYSSEECKLSDGIGKQEKQQIVHRHLMELREQNSDMREKLTQVFMHAIIESINQEDSDSTYFWKDGNSDALMDTFKRLVESGMTILEVRNPM